MRPWLPCLCLILAGSAVPSFGQEISSATKTAAERGREILFHRSMNPPVWSNKAYEEVWKQWGLSEKPRDYPRDFRERYGLPSPLPDHRGLPLGLIEAQGFFGKGIVNNCLLCHAGTIAGQTYLGLGNASLDLQSLFEDLTAAEGMKLRFPFQFATVRGTIDPVSPVAFLLGMREPDLTLRKPIQLDYFENLCSKPPAWWQLKRKKTRDWTGGLDARSLRVDMANLLNPLNSAAYIKEQESAFAAIHAFVTSVEAPKYPFAIDATLAGRGKELFGQHCAKCHGTPGPAGNYPNKIVPLGVIGTDRLLAETSTSKNMEHFNRSWFAQERGPDGETYLIIDTKSYQAPPLDGIWSTAPYFHNGSVPTLYHVLNSKERPKVFTRSYRTGKEDYDPVKVGWKITELNRGPDPKQPALECRKIYDASQGGRGNGGHVFGDELTDKERWAVIEYLKTL